MRGSGVCTSWFQVHRNWVAHKPSCNECWSGRSTAFTADSIDSCREELRGLQACVGCLRRVGRQLRIEWQPLGCVLQCSEVGIGTALYGDLYGRASGGRCAGMGLQRAKMRAFVCVCRQLRCQLRGLAVLYALWLNWASGVRVIVKVSAPWVIVRYQLFRQRSVGSRSVWGGG